MLIFFGFLYIFVFLCLVAIILFASYNALPDRYKFFRSSDISSNVNEDAERMKKR